MDADLSHDPELISKFVSKINEGYDFVIGSRYVKGGSIPDDWAYIRKLNSKMGNLLARCILPLHKIKDCTSGYRAIHKDIFTKINFDKLGVKGYSFQINLLYYSIKKGAKVKEIPIDFQERKFGKSKLKISDILEFILSVIKLIFKSIIWYVLFILVILSIIYTHSYYLFTTNLSIEIIVAIFSTILTIQSIFTIVQNLYSWENPTYIDRHKSPKIYEIPHYSFTAIIPARFEQNVIRDTILSVSNIDYPEELKEIIIVLRYDDQETISKVNESIDTLKEKNIKVLILDDLPINKPHSLNAALAKSSNNIIGVFDAEDEPVKDIYNIINTVILKDNVDIVQSGVQLMNFQSHWFSMFNVLEYYFWFKSSLHFFTRIFDISPLGGNTCFFKRELLINEGGWDENCLTEDAEIGINLSIKGAKIRVVYDEAHVTKEETPSTIGSFIKQRTRWNQGFLQVLDKGDWKRIKSIKKKIFTIYVLLSPFIQSLFFLLIPLDLFIIFYYKLPVLFVMYSFIPLYLFIFQMIINIIGMYEFKKSYNLKSSLYIYLKIILGFYPYQLLLLISSVRAILRNIKKSDSWEKTTHFNEHRNDLHNINLDNTLNE